MLPLHLGAGEQVLAVFLLDFIDFLINQVRDEVFIGLPPRLADLAVVLYDILHDVLRELAVNILYADQIEYGLLRVDRTRVAVLLQPINQNFRSDQGRLV